MRYLGIDGGGSKTTFLLVDEYYNELCHLHTGPSNWLSVGADAAKSAIRDGVSKLTERPNVVCAGFAGAARAESASFYREVLTTLIPDATIIGPFERRCGRWIRKSGLSSPGVLHKALV